jgi:predicted glycogen debranching enzyme
VAEHVRRLSLVEHGARASILDREWLVTNGLGGYASGTVGGAITNRYHGLLIAAMGAPLGRVVMLTHVLEEVQLPDGPRLRIGGGDPSLERKDHLESLVEFRLEDGLPVWQFAVGEAQLERRVLLPHDQNTVQTTYRMLQGSSSLRLALRPFMHFRRLDAPVSRGFQGEYVLSVIGDRFEARAAPELPVLRILLLGEGSTFEARTDTTWEVTYPVEAIQGYDPRGLLWSPGTFTLPLAPGGEVALLASTEAWDILRALTPVEARAAEAQRRHRLLAAAQPGARKGFAAELTLAADQFLITPAGRSEDVSRRRAAGDEVRTVIAGYPWFTDWGRDTMITLEGLTLVTGRHVEAGWILRTFAHYVRDGLIPNMFPEGEKEGLYHTADATLWFFHALDRYLDCTQDRATLRLILPKLLDIAEHHLRGTRFGIGVDPEDGLLRQGAPGYQLTWMDAKVDDWVVTPRRGKAVEINALWYNALRLLARWLTEERGQGAAQPYARHAARARTAFNARFWYGEGGYCYDVVDGESGDDPACRPNQLFAISLPHPVLDEARWASVVQVARQRLLTPLGLRSLAPGHPDYKPKYFGDLRARDAAYHQGTVWAWLMGPFVDAYLRVHPEDRAGACGFLDHFEASLEDACVGSLSEIFDAEPPFTPRGCIAQAWSVAEILRCLVNTAVR